MFQVRIRKANEADLDELAKLQTQQNLLHRLFDRKTYSAIENFEETWIKLAKSKLNNRKHFFLMAECRKTIIGFIHGDIRAYSLRKIKNYGHINDIFVKKYYRNRRVGSKLTEELIKRFEARKISYVQLGVNIKNKNAIEFYRKLGFKQFEMVMKKDI